MPTAPTHPTASSEELVHHLASSQGVRVELRKPLYPDPDAEANTYASTYRCTGAFDGLQGLIRQLEQGSLPWTVKQVRVSRSIRSQRDPKALGMRFVLELPVFHHGYP